MSLSTTMLQSDLNFMIADLPTTVTWNGNSYSCIVSDIDSNDVLDIAGVNVSSGFQVIISCDDFTTFPVCGDRVTISGTNYRITSISSSPDGISKVLTCAGDTQ